jgi:hypothetical protein
MRASSRHLPRTHSILDVTADPSVLRAGSAASSPEPPAGTCHRRGDWQRRRREPVGVVAEPLPEPAIAVPRRLVLYQAVGDMEDVDRVQED